MLKGQRMGGQVEVVAGRFRSEHEGRDVPLNERTVALGWPYSTLPRAEAASTAAASLEHRPSRGAHLLSASMSLARRSSFENL
jgi:hypothetical protein